MVFRGHVERRSLTLTRLLRRHQGWTYHSLMEQERRRGGEENGTVGDELEADGAEKRIGEIYVGS